MTDNNNENRRGLRIPESPHLSSIEGFPQQYAAVLAEYSVMTALQFIGIVGADRRNVRRLLGASTNELKSLEQLARNASNPDLLNKLDNQPIIEHGMGALPPKPRIVE